MKYEINFKPNRRESLQVVLWSILPRTQLKRVTCIVKFDGIPSFATIREECINNMDYLDLDEFEQAFEQAVADYNNAPAVLKQEMERLQQELANLDEELDNYVPIEA